MTKVEILNWGNTYFKECSSCIPFKLQVSTPPSGEQIKEINKSAYHWFVTLEEGTNTNYLKFQVA